MKRIRRGHGPAPSGVPLRPGPALTLVATLSWHQAQVFGVAFHPRQPLLATGSIDQAVRLWN